MSSPVLIWQPGGGVPPSGIGTIEDAINGAGVTQLVEGQSYIDVTFNTIQTDDEWIFVECTVVNTTDPDPLNIWPGLLTGKTPEGFRLQLNGMPDSDNYFLHWAISGVNIEPTPATIYTLSGPASGPVGVASSNFTVALPPSATVSGSVTVTPHDGGDGGMFTPSSVTLSTGTPSATFTYTPVAYGAGTISVTNDGGLTDPVSVAFTCVATTYTLTGPSGGSNSTPSTNFTVALPASGVVIGTVTVTPSDGGGGGTFTPTTVGLTTGAPSVTFTYTPASAGAKTISVTNDGGLTNPGNLTYTVTGVALLTTLISYWKLDEASGTRNDSNGTNHLAQNGGTVTNTAGKINNAASFGGVGAPALAVASNASLQVTGDCTFSCWVSLYTTAFGGIIAKGDVGTGVYEYAMTIDPATGFALSVGTAAAVNMGSAVSTGVAYHIVGWYDSATSKCYLRINDATTYTGTVTGSPLSDTKPFGVGCIPYVPNVYYILNGYVDEVGFWKRVLTAAEITALYNGGAGLPYSSFT